MTSKNTWNALAEDDAMFYILTDINKKDGKWNLDEFLETGRKQWQQFKNLLSNYGLERAYSTKGKALDLGCGTGRMAFAMSEDFNQVIGIDVSEDMIEKANINKDLLGINNCEFLVNNGMDISDIANESIDFCLSYIVLQHCPSGKLVLNYIKEFSRVLKPDGVMFIQFRVAPTLLFYYRFILSRMRVKIQKLLFRRGKINFKPYYDLDALAGNWVSLPQAYREISKYFRSYYLLQSPVEIYKERFWELSDKLERWKRSYWLCMK
jgi:ubiquinone/menaquinone biosynthesis C-methylase UbiE